MKKAVLAAALLLPLAGAIAAEEYATPRDAEQMVAKAVAAIAKDGSKVYAAITAKEPAWVHGDLYPVVYDLEGKVLAHGQSAKMVGKDMIEMRDVDGKAYIRERMTLAKQKSSFWQDYKFVDPMTKSIQPKRMYCQRSGEIVVCAGVYQR